MKIVKINNADLIKFLEDNYIIPIEKSYITDDKGKHPEYTYRDTETIREMVNGYKEKDHGICKVFDNALKALLMYNNVYPIKKIFDDEEEDFVYVYVKDKDFVDAYNAYYKDLKAPTINVNLYKYNMCISEIESLRDLVLGKDV